MDYDPEVISLSDILTVAEKALMHSPDDFWGGRQAEGLFAPVFSRHRDSNLITQSNYDSLLMTLNSKSRENWYIVRDSHWAVGWTETIMVKVVTDYYKGEVVLGNITFEFETVVAKMIELQNYPVLDEEWLSHLEHSKILENLETDIMRNFGGNAKAGSSVVAQVQEWLSDMNFAPDDDYHYSEGYIEKALFYTNNFDMEYMTVEEWVEVVERHSSRQSILNLVREFSEATQGVLLYIPREEKP